MYQAEVYTDGSCSPNPGVGGWGVYIKFHTPGSLPTEREYFGGDPKSTNNRMELMAAIMALTTIPVGWYIHIFVDSEYVKNGITLWIHSWKKKGWKTATGKTPSNSELWLELDRLTNNHHNPQHIKWNWVEGHATCEGNNKADELANRGRLQLR